MASIQDIFDALVTALAPVAPLAVGRKSKGTNVDLPFILLHLGRDTFSGVKGPGAAANPRALHASALGVEFHCWGIDYANADALKNAVITALRQTVSGANYALDSGEWVDGENIERGVVYVLSARILMAVPLVNLTNPPTYATQATTTITSIVPDPTGIVQGDGKLDWGETA